MRKWYYLLLIIVIVNCILLNKVYSQSKLQEKEYTVATLNLNNILDLRIIGDTRIDFLFRDIQDYKNGITIFNAVKLEVDATVGWDLFAYASTDNWILVDGYSSNGNYYLPAEILEMKSSVLNNTAATNNFNTFVSLKGLTNSEATGGKPTLNTQFLAGMKGLASSGAGDAGKPGTAAGNPDTHVFYIHYRLVPGVSLSFPNSTVDLNLNGNNEYFAKAGYYYLDVVFSLVEDL